MLGLKKDVEDYTNETSNLGIAVHTHKLSTLEAQGEGLQIQTQHWHLIGNPSQNKTKRG